MRLLYLLVDDLAPAEEEVARIASHIRTQSRPGTEVTVEPIRIGPRHYYESALGLALTAPGVLESVLRHQDDTDAILLGCFGDPGLEAARLVSAVPVIGAGEASLIVAQLYTPRFGVVHIEESNIPECTATVARLGIAARCAGMTAIGMPFDSLLDAPDETLRRLQRCARQLMDQGAAAIVLGCLSLGTAGFAAPLRDQLGIPVIDPVAAASSVVDIFLRIGAPPRPSHMQLGPAADFLSGLAVTSTTR